jgi:hypothetical protein
LSRFVARLASKFTESANMSTQHFLPKHAEYDAELVYVEKDAQKACEKSYQ